MPQRVEYKLHNTLLHSADAVVCIKWVYVMALCTHDHPISMGPATAPGQPGPAAANVTNDLSGVRHVIAVVSGKGGVGKSLVSGIIATNLMRAHQRVGILDADITGPSIPKMFGLTGKHATGLGNIMLPQVSKHSIKIMSANLILKDESDPVIWRGPILAGAIRQFWEETSWGALDWLVVDMPPGTGDIALTVFKTLPIEGVVVVSTPQDLSRMIVGKALKMAELMKIPVLGLVENMSFITCPCCGTAIELFGKSHSDQNAQHFDIPVLGRLGIDPRITQAADKGKLEEELPDGLLQGVIDRLQALDGAPQQSRTMQAQQPAEAASHANQHPTQPPTQA